MPLVRLLENKKRLQGTSEERLRRWLRKLPTGVEITHLGSESIHPCLVDPGHRVLREASARQGHSNELSHPSGFFKLPRWGSLGELNRGEKTPQGRIMCVGTLNHPTLPPNNVGLLSRVPKKCAIAQQLSLELYTVISVDFFVVFIQTYRGSPSTPRHGSQRWCMILYPHDILHFWLFKWITLQHAELASR